MGDCAYFSLLKELIEQMQHSIFMKIYFWNDDDSEIFIADKLIKAVQKM